MTWICALIFWSVVLWGRVIRGKWINLLTILSGFYALTITLANLCLYDIKPASNTTCFVLIIGILAYTMGYTLIIYLYQRRKAEYTNDFILKTDDTNIIGNCGKYSIRRTVVILMLVFVLGYTLYRLYWTFDLLSSGYSYNQIRTIYFENSEIFDESVAARYGRSRLDIYVFYPCIYSLIFISCINFFTNILHMSQKKKTQFLITVFVCVFISAITNGGREIIFYSFLILGFCYLITHMNKSIYGKTRKKLTKKQKKLIRIVIICACMGMIALTFMRSSTGENSLQTLFKTVYIYFAGYIPNLSIRLEYFDSSNYTCGYTFFLGLIKIFASGLKTIFDIPFSNQYIIADTLTTTLQARVDIGGGVNFNAYVSLFYYFFMDYGYLSLVIESFLFGLFCSVSEKQFDKNPNCLNMFILVFAFDLIISSMVRWEMVHPKTAMIIYYIFIIFKRNKKKELAYNVDSA